MCAFPEAHLLLTKLTLLIPPGNRCQCNFAAATGPKVASSKGVTPGLQVRFAISLGLSLEAKCVEIQGDTMNDQQ